MGYKFWNILYGIIMMNDAERIKSTGIWKKGRIGRGFEH